MVSEATEDVDAFAATLLLVVTALIPRRAAMFAKMSARETMLKTCVECAEENVKFRCNAHGDL